MKNKIQVIIKLDDDTTYYFYDDEIEEINKIAEKMNESINSL